MRAAHDEPTGEVDTLDEVLDRELRVALNVDPSPALAARVRTEIASAPARTSGRFTWVRFAGVLAVAASLVLAIAATLRPGVPQDVHSTPLIGPRQASMAAAAAPTNDLATVVPAIRRAGPPVSHTRPAEPSVQFSQADIEGLRHLVRLASQEDAGLEDLLARAEEQPTANAGITIREIQIVPLVIERLEPDAY